MEKQIIQKRDSDSLELDCWYEKLLCLEFRYLRKTAKFSQLRTFVGIKYVSQICVRLRFTGTGLLIWKATNICLEFRYLGVFWEFWWILVNSESKSRNDQLVSEIQKRNELTIWGLHKNVKEYLNMKCWKRSKWDLQLSHYFADDSLLFQKLVSQITTNCSYLLC